MEDQSILPSPSVLRLTLDMMRSPSAHPSTSERAYVKQQRSHQDVAASLFKQEPRAEQLALDAGGVRPGHVALGQGQNDGAASRLRVRQRLPGLHETGDTVN